MKKGLAFILLVLYFALSSGVVINLHYCMNRFDSSSLGAAKSEVCGKCGMHSDDANSCCNDEVKIIKIEDGHQFSAINFKFTSPEVIIDHSSFYLTNLINTEKKNQVFTDQSPPFSKQDTYLVNCVFRI